MLSQFNSALYVISIRQYEILQLRFLLDFFSPRTPLPFTNSLPLLGTIGDLQSQVTTPTKYTKTYSYIFYIRVGLNN